MKRPLLLSIGLFLFAPLTASVDAQALKVTFEPVFEGDFAGPTRVTIANRGGSRRGDIISSGYPNSTIYPVELPASSIKEVIVSGVGDYSYQPLRFVSGRFSVEEPYGYASPGRNRAAVIHDEPEAIVRLKGALPLMKVQWGMFPCRPEEAPERAAAYSGYCAVWLVGGSERLSEDQVAALRAYVIGGGSLIFSGGTHAGALKDPRWTSLLGVRAEGLANKTAKLMPDVPALTFGSVSLSGSPWPHKLLEGFAAYRPMGMGRVTLMACSFFDAPFESAGVTSRLCAKILVSASRSGPPQERLTSWRFEDPTSWPAGSVPGGPPPLSPGLGSPAYSPPVDAFTYTPPEAGTLFAAVWVFALILAPLAILLPRLFKRAELAWALTPLAAVGAAVFVMSEQGALRSMKLSQQTKGMLFIQEGAEPSVLYAKSDIFIPRAGGYDFGMAPAEMVTMEGGTSQFGANSGAVYDLGGSRVPPISAKNLEFRTLRYQSLLTGMGGWLEVKRVGGTSKLEITNRSPHKMTDIRVAEGRPEGSLDPGKSLIVDGSKAKGTIPSVHFVVTGLEVGPSLGRERQTISVTFQLARSPW